MTKPSSIIFKTMMELHDCRPQMSLPLNGHRPMYNNILQSTQQVANMVVNADFSADVIVRP